MKHLRIKKNTAEQANSSLDSSVSLTPIAVEKTPNFPRDSQKESLGHSEDKGHVSIALKAIKKDYYVDGKPFNALKSITLAFPERGFVAILGPSGCGKTTLLNIIGGLDHYTSGDLLIDGKSTQQFSDAEWDGYRNERIGFVFQSYNLIPHENILQNVEVSLLLNGVSKNERNSRALAALKLVGLEGSAKKRPNQLSGGQMQRVALARAIVNNPKIVLADEPTGALDSGTSIQVMDEFKSIAKDRLVIMVTHNRDLADQYADRIIEMKDGVVTRDSAPMSTEGIVPTGKEITKKTSMSFFTALHSSLLNIGTKKGRTILTAVASSIGLIGVALVLAVSNGFGNYVKNVEGSVASSVPITITPVDYSYLPNDEVTYEEYPSDNNLNIYDTSNSSYVIHRNNYKQDYFDYVSKTVEKGWARSVMFNRLGYGFNLLTEEADVKDSSGAPNIVSINQYSSASAAANVVSSVTSLPATIFHEIYGEEKGISTMYDLIYGSYPKDENDLVLITDRYNRVELSTLKSLGIVNDASAKKISFDDLVYTGEGDTAYKSYKAYKNSDFYKMKDANGNDTVKTETVPAWSISSFDLANKKYKGTPITKTISYYENDDAKKGSYKNIYNDDSYHPLNLRIVGVLRPSKESYISLMPSSIGYLSSLKDDLVSNSQSGQKGENLAQIASQNYYINRGTDSRYENSSDGLDTLNAAVKTVLDSMSDSSQTALSESTFENLFSSAYTFRSPFSNGNESYPGFLGSFSGFLTWNRKVGGDFKENNVVLPATPKDTSSQTWTDFVTFWTKRLVNPAFYNGTEPDWSAIDFEAYFNGYALVSSVLIFPKSLTTKDALHDYLDAYNNGKADVDQIQWSDIMETFTGSLSVLIQIISVVLIVFAAISLVVSSVMTGIITYVSVVERTKEIGILRACGARKKDVGRLFEAECTIIGFAAGVIGMGFTYLACIPINLILDHLYPDNNLSTIASLNPWHALILLILAIVLALISGLIPSRMAAKKDPVVALRTE